MSWAKIAIMLAAELASVIRQSISGKGRRTASDSRRSAETARRDVKNALRDIDRPASSGVLDG
jgi:hypothetical protein